MLGGAIAVLLILSLLPPAWGRWVGTFRNLATTLIAPSAGVFRFVSRPLRSAGAATPDDPLLAGLTEERDRFKTLYLQQRARAEELARQIAEFSKGAALSDLDVNFQAAPVIGSDSTAAGGLLQVKAGSNHGIARNAIATTAGVQLVGRVEDVAARTAWVRLLTDRETGPIAGIAVIDDDRSVGCELIPVGDRLKGQVVYAPDPRTPGAALLAAVGQEVRLQDPEWPRSAQMLLLGTIEKVEPAPARQDRQVITVRPIVELTRIGEVILRTTTGADEDPEGAP